MSLNYRYNIGGKAKELVSNMILVTGTARSGTTVLGKLLHSAEEVEYGYEPPMMFSLVSLIKDLDESHWRLLFETYCYEELMLGYIAGRNLNFNVNDDSYILNAKTKAAVEERLNTAHRKKQLESGIGKRILCIKTPDITRFIPKIQSYYPGIKVIVVVRSANEVINSLIKKDWYNDMSIESSNVVWPFRIYKGHKIPFWVEEKEFDWWCAASHLERAAYNYIWNMKSMKGIQNKIIVSYNQLIEQPEPTIQDLFSKLSLTFSSKTSEILRSVVSRPATRYDMVGSLPKNMREKIAQFEKKYQLL